MHRGIFQIWRSSNNIFFCKLIRMMFCGLCCQWVNVLIEIKYRFVSISFMTILFVLIPFVSIHFVSIPFDAIFWFQFIFIQFHFVSTRFISIHLVLIPFCSNPFGSIPLWFNPFIQSFCFTFISIIPFVSVYLFQLHLFQFLLFQFHFNPVTRVFHWFLQFIWRYSRVSNKSVEMI